MKKIKNLTLLFVVIFSITGAFSQKKLLEKANKDFDKYSYIDAQKIYLQVANDGYQSPELYKKLGDTYYFNADYENAAKWYTKLVNQYPADTTSDYYYRAAQSLKSLGDYEASDKMMEAFKAIGGNKLIVKNFEDKQYLKDIELNSKDYILERVLVNTKNSDFGTSFYGNNKIVFASNAKKSEGSKEMSWNNLPYLDLFEADMDEEGNLSNATPLNGDINTPYNESSTAFTADGNTVYFTRNNYINGKKRRDKNKTIRLKLYKATKTGETFWTNIVELPFNSDEYSVAHPALSVDEKRLYFSSDMPGGFGHSDIWYVDILGDNTYSDPVNLGPTINTELRETFPYISKENNLYFATDGRAGLGGLDVFVTKLNNKGLPTAIKNIGKPINSNQDDFGFIFNEEKRLGYLSSNRDGKGGSVSDDIYLVTEKCQVIISGLVIDKETKELIPEAEVFLLDENNTLIKSLIVGKDAAFTFNEIDCQKQYTVRAKKQDYAPDEKVVETPNSSSELKLNLELEYTNPCPPDDLGCRLCLQPIFFDFDRYNIRPDAEVELAKILAAMKEYPQLKIHIESHTDSRATFKYNEVLSDKRAQATLNWLVDHGIDRSRLSAKGYGEYQLLNRCIKFDECGREVGTYDCTQEQLDNPKCSDGVKCSEEEHQRNRRSVFIIKN